MRDAEPGAAFVAGGFRRIVLTGFAGGDALLRLSCVLVSAASVWAFSLPLALFDAGWDLIGDVPGHAGMAEFDHHALAQWHRGVDLVTVIHAHAVAGAHVLDAPLRLRAACVLEKATVLTTNRVVANRNRRLR